MSFLLLTYYFLYDIINSSLGDLAQLVEHTAHIRVVSGSIPLVAKKKDFLFLRKSFFLVIRFYKTDYIEKLFKRQKSSHLNNFQVV